MKNKLIVLNAKMYYAATVILSLTVTLGFINISYSQKVEIIQKSDLRNLPEANKYAYIEPTTDTTEIEFVATLLAKDRNKKSIIEKLYFEIREQASKLGANCYKIQSFTRDETKDEAVLILDSYVASDSVLKLNTSNHEKNVVFVFGGEKENDEKTISFNVNGDTKEIKSGTYFKFLLKEGEELKLSKGGMTGAKVWLKWEKGKQPAFYTLSGFGLSDWTNQPVNGISLTTGKINRISNISLGLLLSQLLKQGN